MKLHREAGRQLATQITISGILSPWAQDTLAPFPSFVTATFGEATLNTFFSLPTNGPFENDEQTFFLLGAIDQYDAITEAMRTFIGMDVTLMRTIAHRPSPRQQLPDSASAVETVWSPQPN
ncbi:uncharacterized protein EHS24_004066 [Apiotrichum porosum]|uniref:Uncharacterized protein n=1 Tax=Apiotrichum porosum TaxID=105984 RepID=A0A427Y470_9TREE|nr:uncharacterized protein EHS24_004066 [Apiotrichum porosum]RSH85881.1 hypothetical protein EHS24_004066 [Apiotrichum porosum]